MNTVLKYRLVGAAVLIALAVIFLPILFDGSGTAYRKTGEIPAPPAMPPMPEIRVPEPTPEQAAVLEQPLPVVVEEGVAAETPDDMAARDIGFDAGPQKAPEPARVSPEEPLGAWVVQVASFSDKDNAVGLRDRLRKMGLEAYVEKASPDTTVYRVLVGPYLRKSEARQVLSRIGADLQLTGILKRHQ